MSNNLHIGKTKIEYDLIYTNRKKTVELTLGMNKGFTVRAPEGMAKEDIIRNLERKSK